MTGPAPDARPSSLHRRLTVALADASACSGLADALSDALAANEPGAQALRAEDLQAAASESAARRAQDRAELRSRLQAAADRAGEDRRLALRALQELLDRRSALLDGAAWARSAGVELGGRRQAVEEASVALDTRSNALHDAEMALERVLEQRAAAAAAVEEADRELGTMASVGMDEPGLRRELEIAGRSVTDSAGVLRTAQASLDAILTEQAQVAEDLSASECSAAGGVCSDEADEAQIERVLDAFEAYRDSVSPQSTIVDRPDPAATDLAQAWRDLEADFAEAGGGPRPTDDQVAHAEAAVATASAALQAIEERVESHTLTSQERDAIEAAHAAVLEAEEASGRRFGGGAAKARLEALREAERALLDDHGFATYLDVVLTGGRSVSQDFEVAEAERRYLEAGAALDKLVHAGSSATLTYLESERERLRQHTIGLIGVDPGDRAVELLEAHRTVSSHIVAELASALDAIGVRPVGVPLLDAAEGWLGAQRAQAEERMQREADRAALEGRLAELRARAAELEALAAAGTRTLAEAEEKLELAQRSVEALEEELTVRAGEDTKRLKRLAAAEQLRAQVEAVEATLVKAEARAREALEQALSDRAAAEVAYDQANAAVAEIARQARDLAELLEADQRPVGDVLETLDRLAAALELRAGGMQTEITTATEASDAAAVAHDEAGEAVAIAGRAGDGPQVDDFVEGLSQLLSERQEGRLLILDDPFVGVDAAAREQLLGVVRDGSADRQLILLTDDPDVLGWAIELPAEVGTAVPADALLARARRQPSEGPIHLTDDHTAPTARRHAGRN